MGANCRARLSQRKPHNASSLAEMGICQGFRGSCLWDVWLWRGCLWGRRLWGARLWASGGDGGGGAGQWVAWGRAGMAGAAVTRAVTGVLARGGGDRADRR